MAIAQQLQAESTSQTNSGQTVSVTLGAGSNRYMVVALVAEHATSQAAPTSVTYGGNALALITDGTVTASSISTIGGVFLYRLLEASMPADGARDLVVAWPSSTNYIMGWWILTGVEQANADDVKIAAETTTATSITVTLDAGNTTDAVICASYSNNNPSAQITISGAAITEDFDVDIAGTARGAAGTDLPAVASGTIACVMTTTSTNRRIIAAIRLAEAAAEANASGDIAFATEVAGALSSPRNVDGALSFATSIDVDADFLIEAGGGALTFVTQVDGTLSAPASLSGALGFGWSMAGELFAPPPRELSGALAFGWGLSDGVLDVEGTVMSGAIEFASQVSGSLSVPVDASGAIEFATSIDVDADFIIEADGELEFGWEMAGSLVHVSSLSGALAFGWGLSGRLRTNFPGSCVLLIDSASSVELTDEPAGSATLLDEPVGNVTMEFA